MNHPFKVNEAIMSEPNKKTDVNMPFPSASEFCLSVSLYNEYLVTDSSLAGLAEFLKFDGTLDMYCPLCEEVSVFQCKTNYQYQRVDIDNWFDQDFLTISAVCSRRKLHKSFFFFQLDEKKGIQKVGQYPSAADVASFNIKKYKKVLSNDHFLGLKTAIGLSTHGVGAGSLVYLRRIFESLVAEAHRLASKETGWDDDIFKKGRMQDRVKLLANYLPDFLVKHHKLYGILSNGIHEMPEKDCRDYFPVLKMSIELILDQKLAALELEDKIKEAGTFISKFDEV